MNGCVFKEDKVTFNENCIAKSDLFACEGHMGANEGIILLKRKAFLVAKTSEIATFWWVFLLW